MTYVSVIVCEIWPLVHFLWSLTFTCDLHGPSRSLSFLSLDWRYAVVYNMVPSTKIVGSIEFEIWTIVKGKLKWRHNDVITHSISMKVNHKSTKSIWPWLRIGFEVWRCKVISVFELRFLLIHANFLKIFLFFLFSTSLAQLPDKMYDSTEKNSIQRRT